MLIQVAFWAGDGNDFENYGAQKFLQEEHLNFWARSDGVVNDLGIFDPSDHCNSLRANPNQTLFYDILEFASPSIFEVSNLSFQLFNRDIQVFRFA